MPRKQLPNTMNNPSFTLSGQIVDLIHDRIFPGEVIVEEGKIIQIVEKPTRESRYLLPGFIDSHIHIESSMLPPAEFARLSVCHGTVAAVCDPHEIANVVGTEGVRYMITNGKRVPFKFYFGAPSCVPATSFETTGATMDANLVDRLLAHDTIHFLSEMMNYPGVLNDDPEILQKIASAKKYGKPVDGHAPGLRGDALRKYVSAGISTDHECYTREEAEEKLGLGMKILIREGSAAKNFETLIPLMSVRPDMLMFCSDDKHPNELVEGHINRLVKRAIELGYDCLSVLKAASLNAIRHYHLDVGMLQPGDDADFIVVDNLRDFNVLQTFVQGKLVAEKGVTRLPHQKERAINNFKAQYVGASDIELPCSLDEPIKVIGCTNDSLITNTLYMKPKVEDDKMVSDTTWDMLKIVVYNRYTKARPAVAFIHGMGLTKGAIASSVAHDSHNIVAVGCSDEEIVQAINLLISCKGGIVACWEEEVALLPLPVGGLMSLNDGYEVARLYDQADTLAHRLGSRLSAPFMTLAFMSLLVIPELTLSDRGLFDGNRFCFV